MNQYNGKRILVVDDEQDILLLVTKILETVGYDVVTACDGIEALEKVRKVSPDLVILDLMLPGLDGFQICSILKHDRLLKNIPIVIFTARSQIEDCDLGMKLGANAYIKKPFDKATLLERVAELTNKKKVTV